MANKLGTEPGFSKKTKKPGSVPSLFRMIDANFNRAKEGLRVCEDVCRYIWDEKVLTRDYKNLRHQLTESVIKLNPKQLLASRDIHADVGKSTTATELKRADIQSLFWANNQRAKESLRVLEEAAKLIDPSVSLFIKKLRYNLYAIETKALKHR